MLLGTSMGKRGRDGQLIYRLPPPESSGEMAEPFLRGGGVNFLSDTAIRKVVAFVAGEPALVLLPLSRRFVPEPVHMTYIVTESYYQLFKRGVAAWSLYRAQVEIFHVSPLASDMHKWEADIQADKQICWVCRHGVADVAPVRLVTLQTRLCPKWWSISESFRRFISDRVKLVDMHLCITCHRICGGHT